MLHVLAALPVDVGLGVLEQQLLEEFDVDGHLEQVINLIEASQFGWFLQDEQQILRI